MERLYQKNNNVRRFRGTTRAPGPVWPRKALRSAFSYYWNDLAQSAGLTTNNRQTDKPTDRQTGRLCPLRRARRKTRAGAYYYYFVFLFFVSVSDFNFAGTTPLFFSPTLRARARTINEWQLIVVASEIIIIMNYLTAYKPLPNDIIS